MSGEPTATLRVALLSAPHDAEIAAALAGALRDAGVLVVDSSAAPPPDGIVALISLDSVVDQGWRAAVAELPAARVVPVRTDGSIGAEQVPARISAINWIDWDPAHPASTFGFVLAGLYADPDRVQVARSLAQQALVWERGGRDDELLIGDAARAERMLERLEELEADPLARSGPSTRAFVEASLRKARQARRRRRAWQAAAGLVVLGAAAVVSTMIPEIRLRTSINKAAITTVGDDSIMEDQPEWSAANAAALLVHGTETQRKLARATIGRALVAPWSYSSVDHVDSIRSMVSFDRGRQGVAVTFTRRRDRTGLVTLDLLHGRVTSERSLPGAPGGIDVTPDESRAVAAGEGVIAVDLRSGAEHVIRSDGSFFNVRAGASAVAAMTRERAIHLFGYDGRELAVRRFEGVLDVGEPSPEQTHALVLKRQGMAAIVDLVSGRTLAEAPAAPSSVVGTLSPDGAAAIVTGADGQLWRFDRDGRSPTGIPVPVALNDLEWARGDRLVLASDSERGRVVLLPDGEPLGHVCWGHPKVNELRLDRRADIVACGGSGAAFWRVPPGARASAPAGMSSAGRARGRDITVETKGSRVRVLYHGRFGHGQIDWSSTPLNNQLTAVSISPSGDQVALGSVGGSVAILGVKARAYSIVSVWAVPDAAPVTEVGWDRDGPVARTRDRYWDVPGCPRCQTDEGQLDAVRARSTGCLTERQLLWVSDTVRRRIGVNVCPPVLAVEGG